MKKSTKAMALDMRKRILDISMRTSANSHFGGGLSIVDIMAVLYHDILNIDVSNPEWENRDRFILSKGHGVLGYYTALEQVGFFPSSALDMFQNDFGDFSSHPVMKKEYGIETSNGSLGHGLALGIGSCLAGKRLKRNYNVYVLMGNGECNEGSVWEAIMAAAQFRLDNLIAIVDCNGMQSDGVSQNVMSMSDMEQKFKAFGWNTTSVDGHDYISLREAFLTKFNNEKPSVIIANTIKGKGISFMENNNEWHHNQMSQQQYEQAMEELEALC